MAVDPVCGAPVFPPTNEQIGGIVDDYARAAAREWLCRLSRAVRPPVGRSVRAQTTSWYLYEILTFARYATICLLSIFMSNSMTSATRRSSRWMPAFSTAVLAASS